MVEIQPCRWGLHTLIVSPAEEPGACGATFNYVFMTDVTYICGNIINNNDERAHFFRKIDLSHFILEKVTKGLCVRGELETE